MSTTRLETKPGKVLAATTTATLTLEDIRFANFPVGSGKDLTRPLYPALINYPAQQVDLVQVDLGIHVGQGVDELKIDLALRPEDGVSFRQEDDGDPQRVMVRELDSEDPWPGVSASFGKGNDKTCCTFSWKRELTGSMPQVRAFRIFCQQDHVFESGVDPSDWETVYGGLFVVIINKPRPSPPDSLIDELSDPLVPGRVDSLVDLELTGVDAHGRPLYNIFKDYSALISSNADFEIEPTYRLYESALEPQELDIDFGLSRLVTFTGELKLHAPTSPRSLFGCTFQGGNTSCRLVWRRRETGEDLPEAGVSSCQLGVSLGDLPADVYADGLSRFPSVDPTVIEPPRCMNGVCVG